MPKNQGSILLAILITFAIAVGSGYFFFMQSLFYRQLDNSLILLHMTLRAKVTSIQSILNDPQSLVKTLKLAENDKLWSCASDPEFNCDVSGPQPFYITTSEIASGQFYMKMNSSAGFSNSFQACDSFPSVSCPYRYEMTWSTTCTRTPCTSPRISVQGKLKTFFDTSKRSGFNASAYDLTYWIQP